MNADAENRTERQSSPPREHAHDDVAEAGPGVPLSVNLHLTARCNYHCQFCYQTLDGFRASLPSGDPEPLDRDGWLRVQTLLADAGVRRITYAGGEPTIFPGLDDLVFDWHRLQGGNTPHAGIVTNGTGLTEARVRRLQPTLLSVKLSAESFDEETERVLGRGRGQHVAQTIANAAMLHRAGVPVDLNSVICRTNLGEDLTSLVRAVAPRFWKVFQFLPVPGQNDAWIDALRISEEEFRGFLLRHAHLNKLLVPEDNDLMQESCSMIDPAGRFYQSGVNGCSRSTHSILDIGVDEALREVPIDRAKYDRRGGDRRAFGGREGRMRKTHARPSKKFVCGKCKRRIRWMSEVHLAGGRGQLIRCEDCWREALQQDAPSHFSRGRGISVLGAFHPLGGK